MEAVQPMSALTLLDELIAWFCVQDHWRKSSNAADVHGNKCNTRDPAATCFCLLGRTQYMQQQANWQLHNMKQVLRAIGKSVQQFNAANGRQDHGIAGFNDHPATTLDHVQQVLADARKLLQEE